MKKLLSLLLLLTAVVTQTMAVTWEVTYPVGGKASSVDDVQIKCTEVAYRYLAEDATATLNTEDGTLVRTLVRDDITLSFKGNYCTVDFELDPAITEPGNYTISVPEGIFSTTEGAENEAFAVNFTVEASSYTVVDADWTCVFPEGGSAASLENVLLTSNYTWESVSPEATASLYDSTFNVVASLNATNNLFAYMGGLMVAFDPAITTPGQYMLVINEGAVISTTENVTNSEAYIELTIEEPAPVVLNPEWTVTYPIGAKASSVDDVQIKCEEVAFRYLAEDATAKLYDSEGTEIKSLVRDDITLSYKGTYCTVDFEFDPVITDVGSYTIVVPQGVLSNNDGDINGQFSVNFTVEATSFTPVDPSWTCVFPEGGSAASLEYILLKSIYNWDVVSPTATAALYDSKFNEVASLNATNNLFIYDNGLMVVFDPAITTPGDYALVINDGAVISNTETVTNSMSLIELKVENTPSYTVSAMPEDNSTISASTGIAQIYVSVDGYAFSEANSTGTEMTITKDGVDYAYVGATALSKAMDNSTMLIDLPEEAQMKTVGNYVVTMPAGFFVMRNNEGDVAESPEITLHYTISAPTGPLSWTIEPAAGVVDKIDTVTITFNKPVKAAITNTCNLFYTNYSYLPETVTEGVISVSDDGMTATIVFDPVFANCGIYQIRLFEGSEQLSVVDGETFPGINITYKVDAPLYTECTPEAGSSVASLQETKVVLPYNNKIAKGSEFAAWYVKGEDRVKAEFVKCASYDFGDKAYFTVKSDEPITENGDWQLVVEAGSLVISNYDESMESPETIINFTVDTLSCINLLDGEDGNVNVYSMDGVCLYRNANVEQVRNLAPGMYIINGKKVILR